MSVNFDPRLYAYRADVADIALKGRVKAKKFISPQKRRVFAPVADIYARGGEENCLISQLLMGDEVYVFDKKNGFSFIQSVKDSYVGYMKDAFIGDDESNLTHYVRARSSFLYPKADLKSTPVQALSLGTKVGIVDFVTYRGLIYGVTKTGTAVFVEHLSKMDDRPHDYVSVAEKLLHTPYLWGGASSFGIDCSGLVQLAMALCGVHVLRDSDMQRETIGSSLAQIDKLQRGDLIFWPGHVAIMQDEKNTLHANGKTMDVSSQPLTHIIQYMGQPLCCRRP